MTDPSIPTRPRGVRHLAGRLHALGARLVVYLRDQDPTLRAAYLPALVVALLLYVRSPLSNYIFDEQEALLANPYVNAQELG